MRALMYLMVVMVSGAAVPVAAQRGQGANASADSDFALLQAGPGDPASRGLVHAIPQLPADFPSNVLCWRSRLACASIPFEGGGSMDDLESKGRFTSTKSPAELAAFFAAEMTALGWKVTGTLSDPTQSMTRLSSTSRAGDPVTAMLIFTALDGTPSIEGVLRVVRNKLSR